MKKTKANPFKPAWFTAVLGAAGSFGAVAHGMDLGGNPPPVTFHDLVSQALLSSNSGNYLDTDAKNGTFAFYLPGLDALADPLFPTCMTAQAFNPDLDKIGRFKAILDGALAEYASPDSSGAPTDGIHQTQGGDNSVADEGLARPYLLLAPGLDYAHWRDAYLALAGGEGLVGRPFNEEGDIYFESYAGEFYPPLDSGAGNGHYLPPNVQLDAIHSATETGGQFWWNSPVPGLRAGTGGGYVFGFAYDTSILTGAGDILIPKESSHLTFLQGSLEYLWKAWTFQTAYYTYYVMPDSGVSTELDAWSASAAYRFNRWLAAGACYTQSHDRTDDGSNTQQSENDLALAFRFDPTKWWSFKLEGHYLEGSGLLDEGLANASAPDNHGRFLLAIKTTVSF